MRSLLRSTGILVVATIFLSGCASFGELSDAGVEIAQIPITENPSGQTYPGKFIWHDLVTPDALAAGTFYEKLFGWQVEYRGQYAVVRNGDKLIAGILQVKSTEDTPRDGSWIPSVSVPDVDAAARQVKAGGGKILNGPVDMGKRGRAVLINDPQQADLVLLSARGGDPADAEAEIGDWLWDEIWTSDPETIGNFYRDLLGYDEVVSGENYDVLLHKEKWRAGIRHVSDDSQHPRWVPVVRVADPQATSQRVAKLGGVVWIAPEDAPSKGDTALIGDPTGALLLIQRWPPQSSGKEL